MTARIALKRRFQLCGFFSTQSVSRVTAASDAAIVRCGWAGVDARVNQSSTLRYSIRTGSLQSGGVGEQSPIITFSE